MTKRVVASFLAVATIGLVLVPAGIAMAQVPPIPTACPEADPVFVVSRCASWLARYDNGGASNDEQALGIATSPDGESVFVTGNDYVQNRIVTIGYDTQTGAERWKAFFTRPGSGYDTQVRDITIAPDGSTVFITGFSRNGAIFNQMVTVAYDPATGAEKWVAFFGSEWEHGDYGYDVEVSPDSETVYVAGDSYHVNPDGSGDRSFDYRVVAYDALEGSEEWASSFDSIGDIGNHGDHMFAMELSPDGKHIVMTGRWAAQGIQDGYEHYYGNHIGTISVDAQTGAKEWLDEYTDGSNEFDQGNDVVFSPDSSKVFIAGDSYNGFSYERRTLAYDAATGERIWVDEYSATGWTDFGRATDVSPDGEVVYVTGESVGGVDNPTNLIGNTGALPEIGTQALDADTGERIWDARYSVPRGSHSDDLVVAPDGRIYVTGATWTFNGWNIVTLSYEPVRGAEQWVARFTSSQTGVIGDQDDWDPFIAVAPDGSEVYVTGTGSGGGSTGKDFVTMAYER